MGGASADTEVEQLVGGDAHRTLGCADMPKIGQEQVGDLSLPPLTYCLACRFWGAAGGLPFAIFSVLAPPAAYVLSFNTCFCVFATGHLFWGLILAFLCGDLGRVSVGYVCLGFLGDAGLAWLAVSQPAQQAGLETLDLVPADLDPLPFRGGGGNDKIL